MARKVHIGRKASWESWTRGLERTGMPREEMAWERA